MSLGYISRLQFYSANRKRLFLFRRRQSGHTNASQSMSQRNAQKNAISQNYWYKS